MCRLILVDIDDNVSFRSYVIECANVGSLRNMLVHFDVFAADNLTGNGENPINKSISHFPAMISTLVETVPSCGEICHIFAEMI